MYFVIFYVIIPRSDEEKGVLLDDIVYDRVWQLKAYIHIINQQSVLLLALVLTPAGVGRDNAQIRGKPYVIEWCLTLNIYLEVLAETS